jgi:hypothetical protein
MPTQTSGFLGEHVNAAAVWIVVARIAENKAVLRIAIVANAVCFCIKSYNRIVLIPVQFISQYMYSLRTSILTSVLDTVFSLFSLSITKR